MAASPQRSSPGFDGHSAVRDVRDPFFGTYSVLREVYSALSWAFMPTKCSFFENSVS